MSRSTLLVLRPPRLHADPAPERLTRRIVATRERLVHHDDPGRLHSIRAFEGATGQKGNSHRRLVVQRRREIGIRMALGATASSILRNEIGMALRLTTSGLVLGALVAVAAGGLLRSQLYGISSTDPTAIFGAASLLALLTAATAYLPARKASRVDSAAVLTLE